jgi:hypothetical protein
MNTIIPELQLIDAPINFPQWVADQYAKAYPLPSIPKLAGLRLAFSDWWIPLRCGQSRHS